jgi:hypothetical protein
MLRGKVFIVFQDRLKVTRIDSRCYLQFRFCVRKRLVRIPSGLTVCEGSALSDLDYITVRIADVAARLAVLWDRLGDELGSSTFP